MVYQNKNFQKNEYGSRELALYFIKDCKKSQCHIQGSPCGHHKALDIFRTIDEHYKKENKELSLETLTLWKQILDILHCPDHTPEKQDVIFRCLTHPATPNNEQVINCYNTATQYYPEEITQEIRNFQYKLMETALKKNDKDDSEIHKKVCEWLISNYILNEKYNEAQIIVCTTKN